MGNQWLYSTELTFEKGARAGDLLLDLLVELCPKLKPRCDEFLSESELSPLFDHIAALSKNGRVPYVNGFLSRIVKSQELAWDDITIWGIDAIIHNQTQYAPICNLPQRYQFFQFGYWRGDLCDGDGWCLDLEDDFVRCLPVEVSADPEIEPLIEPHSVRRSCYAVFPELDCLAAYLRYAMQKRGKLDRVKKSRH